MGAAVAVVLGAGSGERLGASEPKAFLDLEGSTLLEWAVRSARGSRAVSDVVAVVPGGFEDRARGTLADTTVLKGGSSRQASVLVALRAIGGGAGDVVVIHDAARPFASSILFDSVAGAVEDAAGAVPVVPVMDTVKRVNGDRVLETVTRDGLVLVQTPQAFRFGPLLEAHEKAVTEAEEFTDDAALVEWARGAIRTVPGERDNLKVTTVEDLDLARAIARTRSR
jgi:2-C-methyl-D-erythritol 4-phosphate cytidylyltransferase / 2-C-methyl-D-erythritol 2,4-cyclodiphosphate synthase